MSEKRNEIIKSLREKAGMTQTELAERLGVSKSVISAYEKGIRNPSHKNLVQIANVFNISVLKFYERGYWKDEPITVDITDLKPEQQKIIYSLIDEFKKCNENNK